MSLVGVVLFDGTDYKTTLEDDYCACRELHCNKRATEKVKWSVEWRGLVLDCDTAMCALHARELRMLIATEEAKCL